MLDIDGRFMGMLSDLASDMPKVTRARLSTCIVIKDRVVSFGFNQMKSHPLQAKFSKNPDSIFLHAEVDAIKNALRKVDEVDLAKSTMYICRVKKTTARSCNTVYGLAKPCEGCARAIAAFGIRRVVYSTGDGEFTCA